MQEMYAATYAFEGSQWTPVGAAGLLRPQDLGIHLRALSQAHQPVDKLQWHLAGNVFAAYGEFTAQASASIGAACGITALPSASAMLRLAPHLLLSGKALKAEQALPFYIRDKVALTTLERVADQAARAQGV
jgi:tRNA threonylcarbamoyladenosine biosynthesis protein TsaB